MLVGSIRFRQHTTISQLIKLFHLEDVSFVLWNLVIRGKCLVMGQLTFCLLHFREEVNVIKSLLNFDHVFNSIQYGNSSCCKEYDNGSTQLGSKNGCPPKTVMWECFSCWPWLNLISLLPKTHCEFSLFFLQWMLCICFRTNNVKHFFKKKRRTLHCEFLLQKVGKGLI